MINRNYMWDNMKGFLILTVVVGHLLHSFTCTPDTSGISYNFAYWIYTFHMPAFLFVSGYWAKSYCKNGVVRPKKVAYLIGYYVVFQLIFLTVDKLFFNPQRNYTFFDAMIGLWYLMAMVMYYLVLPVFERLKPYIGIPIVVILSLLIGCETDAGGFLSASRTFVFAPYFFVGYYTSEKIIEKICNLKFKFLWGILCVSSSISIWLFANKIFPQDLLNKFDMITLNLFYGHSHYKKMGFTGTEGFTMRIVSYIIAGLMILGLILLTPKFKTAIAHLGKNSLPIYLFHLILILVFVRILGKGIELIVIDSALKGGLLSLAGVALAVLLSLKPFTYPFKWIQKLVDIIYDLPKLSAKNK